MFFTKTFMNKLLSRLDVIEDRLTSDRRAVPVLKETIKQLRKDNKLMLDRVMARDFEQLQIYSAHETTKAEKEKIVLDETFAGEIVDMDKMENLGYETQS